MTTGKGLVWAALIIVLGPIILVSAIVLIVFVFAIINDYNEHASNVDPAGRHQSVSGMRGDIQQHPRIRDASGRPPRGQSASLPDRRRDAGKGHGQGGPGSLGIAAAE